MSVQGLCPYFVCVSAVACMKDEVEVGGGVSPFIEVEVIVL